MWTNKWKQKPHQISIDQKSPWAPGGLLAAHVGPRMPRAADHRLGQGGQCKESQPWGSSYRVAHAWPEWIRGAAVIHTPSAGVVLGGPGPLCSSHSLHWTVLLCSGHGTQPVLCTTHVPGAKAPPRKQPWGHVTMLLQWWRICPGPARTGVQRPHPEQTLPPVAPKHGCSVYVTAQVPLEGEERSPGSLWALWKVSGWDQGLVLGSDYLHHHRSFS